MDILVWFILCLFFSFGLIMIYHWMELFRNQDSFARDELIGIPEILQSKLNQLPDRMLTSAGFSAGIAFSWLLVLFGGLVSPDISQAADYGENTPANYFFQSFLFPVVLSFIWPSLTDLLPSHDREKISSFSNGMFTGCAISLGALNLGIWGIYHQTGFLYMFLNSIVLFIFALYKLHRQYRNTGEGDEDHSFGNTEESDPFSDNFSLKNSSDLSDEDLEL